MHSIETKRSQLMRMKDELLIQTARVEALEAEINCDLSGAVLEDTSVVWKRTFGTTLTYQGMSDLFLKASDETREAAARQLYALATPIEYQYAFWALRWWPYWKPEERKKLIYDVVLSSDAYAHMCAAKLLLFDDMWERTVTHLHPSIDRMWLARFVAHNEEATQWLSMSEPWSRTKLSSHERAVLQQL